AQAPRSLMNLSQFLEHWRIAENPFRGEEARRDAVFARMAMRSDGRVPAAPGSAGVGSAPIAAAHSDFEKIMGEMERPSSAIVFGEKGSGKTAIRLQAADRVAAHNAANPRSKVLLVPYDDLNTILDRYHVKVAGGGSAGKDVLASLQKFRLVDHLDA